MSIASGFTKMKNYILTSSGYKLLSRWTSSQTVHMGDGTDDTDTVEYRFGAIKGITTSTNVSETGYAADAKTVSEINQSLTQSARVFMNENYGKNVSVLATKCDDRYIVSGIIQITNTTIGQDIFEINDNNKFITLKSRSDVMFINISTSKIYLAVGLPGGSGIEANTTAIPSGTYMIYGVIQ